MFGKEQKEVVTDEDVGNYVRKLHEECNDPLEDVLHELGSESGETEDRAECKN